MAAKAHGIPGRDFYWLEPLPAAADRPSLNSLQADIKAKGAVAHCFSRKCSSHFQNQTYNQTIQKSMCITNPSKTSDFQENLLHMLLFWVLIPFDSYAYSYKNRGCRLCNSPCSICIQLPLDVSIFYLLFYHSYGIIIQSIKMQSCIRSGVALHSF